MRARYVTGCLVGLVAPMQWGLDPSMAQSGGASDRLRACLSIARDSERLQCYDRAAKRLTAPRFAGRLSLVTERFEISQPTWLRYQSDGAIFVLYLKTGDDRVVQNLHIGGGGEDSYLIEEPGTYFLQINGSESWRVWLEPSSAPGTN